MLLDSVAAGVRLPLAVVPPPPPHEEGEVGGYTGSFKDSMGSRIG